MTAPTPVPRATLLAPVLVAATLVGSIISSFGAPLIPTVATSFAVPLGTAQWSLTVALVVGAAISPVLGRLGDGPRRRAALLVGLAVVTAGGALAALAGDIGTLLLGRSLQGVGLALAPLVMAIAREALPAAKVPPTIALLSVSSGAGLGVGYPVSGWLAEAWGLRGAYGFGAVVSGLTLLAAAVVVPRPRRAAVGTPRLDLLGALLFAAALGATSIALAQGPAWGWAGPTILGLAVAGVGLFAVWVRHQLRSSAPLVRLRLLRIPAVRRGDACAMALGVAMYLVLTTMTAFVQAPRDGGFGFSASPVVAGLVLVPLALLMLGVSRVLPILTARLGVRVVLAAGCLVAAGGCGFFALAHEELWQAFVASGVLGVGLGVTFAAIPGVIVAAVPTGETGSALGFYQVVRFTGFSVGSALSATILDALAVGGRPSLTGYATVAWTAAGVCVLAALLAGGGAPGESSARR